MNINMYICTLLWVRVAGVYALLRTNDCNMHLCGGSRKCYKENMQQQELQQSYNSQECGSNINIANVALD